MTVVQPHTINLNVMSSVVTGLYSEKSTATVDGVNCRLLSVMLLKCPNVQLPFGAVSLDCLLHSAVKLLATNEGAAQGCEPSNI